MNHLFSKEELSVIESAHAILASKVRTTEALTSVAVAKQFFKTLIEMSEREVFTVVLLDSQNRMIESVELFKGTVNAASVYPREVVKQVLQYNAVSVMFAHNHPSGAIEPSNADRAITMKLQSALATIDVQVLDHIIVGAEGAYSFAEAGIL
ncbi:DNA repair protein RadC [Pseudoalteromonas sp. DL2-H2.2]|uniref:RadC family protein n=1 Tax=Pseudoalteromonas sp. DL2-H2.2 TaxID=2908889 RepID=UPI001F1EE890|nr:DNA repair protein RadC [Pseudoalteromonas sp. DL2-H2.2]MCF2909976.1 DNA repair protein RadC [Pseudoalteromonas sp. DL2-H2.2]